MSRDLYGRSSDDNRSATNDFLVDAINLETTSRIDGVSAEENARATADMNLQNSIDAEVTDRTNADTNLQNSIDAEVTERTTADTNLQNSINDGELNKIVNNITTLQTLAGSLSNSGNSSVDDSLSVSATDNSFDGRLVPQSRGIAFIISQPILITHFKVFVAHWGSSATEREMRIFKQDGTLIGIGIINKLTPVDGWYETKVGPFLLSPGNYRTSCFYDTPNGDRMDTTTRTYNSVLNVLATVANLKTNGTTPLYPTEYYPSLIWGQIGQFRFSVNFSTLETDQMYSGLIDNKNGNIINVSDPLNAQDVATKHYVDVGISAIPTNPGLIVSATNNVQCNNTSFVVMPNMSITPGAGKYLVMFNGNFTRDDEKGDSYGDFAIFNNGRETAHSHRYAWLEAEPLFTPLSTQSLETVADGQPIEVRWRDDDNDDGQVAERSLILVKVD